MLPSLSDTTVHYRTSNVHPMVTRVKVGIFKPKVLVVENVVDDVEPLTVQQVVSNPKWLAAMKLEYNALLANGTWSLVPSPDGKFVVGSNRCFKSKGNQMVVLTSLRLGCLLRVTLNNRLLIILKLSILGKICYYQNILNLSCDLWLVP